MKYSRSHGIIRKKVSLNRANVMKKVLALLILFLAFSSAQAADDKDYDYYKGLQYLNKGMTDEAIALFNTAIQNNPKNAEAYDKRGLAYMKKNDPDKAIANYNKVPIGMFTCNKCESIKKQIKSRLWLVPTDCNHAFAAVALVNARSHGRDWDWIADDPNFGLQRCWKVIGDALGGDNNKPREGVGAGPQQFPGPSDVVLRWVDALRHDDRNFSTQTSEECGNIGGI